MRREWYTTAMPPPVKERTSRFLDIRDPAKSVGLWSHRAEFSTTLHPISPTHETLGRFFNDDLVRFETHAEALEMMRVKGWRMVEAPPRWRLSQLAPPRWRLSIRLRVRIRRIALRLPC